MTYYSKYLKYKNKYLELKNMIGGKLTDDTVDKLWKSRPTNKIHEVTYDSLKDNYSHYCWISGKAYGLGFFLYKIKDGATNQDKHERYGNYAVWRIKLENIGDINPHSHSEKLSYNTTIILTATDGTKLDRGTNFDWSHKDDGWIYRTKDKKTYIAKLV